MNLQRMKRMVCDQIKSYLIGRMVDVVTKWLFWFNDCLSLTSDDNSVNQPTELLLENLSDWDPQFGWDECNELLWPDHCIPLSSNYLPMNSEIN